MATAIQDGIRQLLAEQDWDYFVTANLNRRTNWQGARRLLRDWHARLDRRLLGGRWARKTGQRTLFIAFYEGAETNEHWHMLLRTTRAKNEIFANEAARLWEGLVESGSLDIRPLATKGDALRVGGYITKELWQRGAVERFVLSTEFIA